MIFGISGTKQTGRNRKVSVLQRCPYYRGVRKERLERSFSFKAA